MRPTHGIAIEKENSVSCTSLVIQTNKERVLTIQVTVNTASGRDVSSPSSHGESLGDIMKQTVSVLSQTVDVVSRKSSSDLDKLI